MMHSKLQRSRHRIAAEFVHQPRGLLVTIDWKPDFRLEELHRRLENIDGVLYALRDTPDESLGPTAISGLIDMIDACMALTAERVTASAEGGAK